MASTTTLTTWKECVRQLQVLSTYPPGDPRVGQGVSTVLAIRDKDLPLSQQDCRKLVKDIKVC